MKNNGFILITVVVMLSVMTILVVANFRWVALDWKRNRDLHHMQDHFEQLEHDADRLSKAVLSSFSSHCLLHESSNRVLKTVITQPDCKILDHYFYRITDLGRYPCVKLDPQTSTHHWLVTLVDEHRPHQLLQLRRVTAEPTQTCPETRVVYIHHSLLTRCWRAI